MTMLVKSARGYLKPLTEAEKKFAAVASKYNSAQATLAKLSAAVKKAEELARKRMDEPPPRHCRFSSARAIGSVFARCRAVP